MRILLNLFFFIALAFGADGSIEVVKKVDTLPSLAIEDGTTAYDDSLKKSFFKKLFTRNPSVPPGLGWAGSNVPAVVIAVDEVVFPTT